MTVKAHSCSWLRCYSLFLCWAAKWIWFTSIIDKGILLGASCSFILACLNAVQVSESKQANVPSPVSSSSMRWSLTIRSALCAWTSWSTSWRGTTCGRRSCRRRRELISFLPGCSEAKRSQESYRGQVVKSGQRSEALYRLSLNRAPCWEWGVGKTAKKKGEKKAIKQQILVMLSWDNTRVLQKQYL